MSDPNEPELETVYIAGNIREAKALEALFAEQAIEYEVVPCEFAHSILFGSIFAGAAFQVLSGQAGYCRYLLAEHGFKKGIVPSSAA